MILMIGLILILVTGFTTLAISDYTYGPKKIYNPEPFPTLNQIDPSVIDAFERSERHLLEDFKTNCFPPRPQLFSPRNRRGLHKIVLPGIFEIYSGNITNDYIIWGLSEGPETNDLETEPNDEAVNNVLTELVDNDTFVFLRDIKPEGSEEESVKKLESEDNVEVETDYEGEQDKEIGNTEAVKPTYNYLQMKDIAREKLLWENKEAEVENDKQTTEKEDYDETVQHAFWKGEGDSETIRRDQGKLMSKYMDTTCDPCEDFYQYACGNWGNYNPIPKDKAAFDTFEMLRESLDFILRELLEENIKNSDSEAYIKTKNLYKSCINDNVLQTRGIQPLLDLLDSLGGWPILKEGWNETDFDWLWLMAQLRLYNNDILISEWVGPDIKNSDEYVIQFDQTSLGLPSRDYYLRQVNEPYLRAYENFLVKVAILLGAPRSRAAPQAREILDFETSLAKIMSAPDERRNVSELYQRMSVGELQVYIPQVDWQRYLSIVLRRPCNITENVVIFALRYVEDLVGLLSKTESRTISNYLLWRFVRHRVNNLDDRFQEAKQRFYYILYGREESPPRWKNCIAQVNTNMGMAVGAMFVTKYFDEYSKNDTLIMTKGIQQAFQEILNLTSWIDEDTKRLASEKISAMMLRIGYPDFILSREQLNERYKDVVIEADKYFENTLNILQHLTRVEQGHLGCPVNKTVWNTAPAVVNAYYSRNKNQIMFPAGILQPPFYHRYFPKCLNYGGIGVVIGHEITHGFDDKGRLFDKDGNLHRWWSDRAIDNFHERAKCIIDQYSKYVVEEVHMQIDGENTQGENIADNGGIKQAFRAYKKWVRWHPEADETLPGVNATGDQLFFLNFAQVWCGDTRPAASRNKLKTAVHSPGRFRVIGTLSNSEDFAEVFDCPVGSPMNPIKKCSVW